MQVTSVEFKKWLYLALFCFLLLVDSDKFFADEIKKSTSITLPAIIERYSLDQIEPCRSVIPFPDHSCDVIFASYRKNYSWKTTI